MFLAVHWLLAKSRVENLGTVDGSADDARTQFSLQPKLSALDVGLMERLRNNGEYTNVEPSYYWHSHVGEGYQHGQ